MAYRVYVPTLDDYIYFGTKYLGPGFDGSNQDFCLGSKPYKFDAYKHCMNFYNIDPTTSRDTPWQPLFRSYSAGTYLNYSIRYIKDDQIVRISIGEGPTTSAITVVHIRLVFSTETAVPEREKYLFFSDVKTFYKNENTFRSTMFGISQYGGLGAVGTWNATYKRYDYNITNLRLSLDEFYNSAGIYTPNLPVGNDSNDYPGTIIRYWQGSTFDQWAKNANYNNIGCYMESFGDTWSLSNIIQVDGTPIDPDAPDPTDEDPNAVGPGYPSGPGGGGGDHDPDSDPIDVPVLPTIGVQSLGGVTMYKLTSAEIGVFGRELVSKDVWDAVKLYFQNPMDYIVGCALLPFTPPGSDVWYPKIGLFAFQYAYPIVSEQFVEVDCGMLNINEYWGSCFDYEPYCQITIWLPYIGYRALPVDEIMGRTLYVKYHIDCLTGDCVAFVGVTASSDDVTKVIAQYSGNCAVQMPFGSVTFDNMISAGLQMSAGAGVYAASGGNGGGDTLGNATISMISGMKGEVQQGGVMGCTNGYMSIQKPYIIKRIRHQSLPTNYREMRGYPSNMNATLSQLETGYAEVEDIQLNNIPAMEDERKEIIELLKGGVLL